MPELPEIETIRLQLSQLIIGLTIKDIQIIQRKSFSGDEKLFRGAEITKLRRFGKMLVIDTNQGVSLAVHLKMTGQLIYKKQRTKNKEQKNLQDVPNKYTRVIIHFANGSELYFNDLRRFGWIKVINQSDLNRIIKNIGPDPMKLASEDFYKILHLSKKPVKLILMDQGKLGGVGNIYVNEALFLARINPKIPGNKIGIKKAGELLSSLKIILTAGIKWGGASENNYLNAYGEKGEMQEHFLVYGREGEKCINKCGSEIKRFKQGGRSSFFCPSCQKLN